MSIEERVNKRLGQTIAKKRNAAGFSQEEVAERLGIGREAFSRIERGRVGVSVYKLLELADMFQIGVDAFLIEGSRRATEQVEHIDRLMSGLSVADRQFIVQLVDRLSRRFKNEKDRAAEDENREFLL